MRKPAGPEKRIQNEIILWLQLQSFVLKVWQNDRLSVRGRKIINRYRPAGLPDITGFIRPLSGQKLAPGFAIEVKTEKGRLSPDQEIFLNDCKNGGVLALIARTVDEVIERFKLEGYLR